MLFSDQQTLRSAPCRLLGFVVVLSMVPCLGCGESRPERVPVSGVVLIDGKPLPDCYVQFVPPNGRASRGQADGQGRFSLTCYEENDGVLLGEQKVSVSAFKELDGVTIRWDAPKKYLNHKTSDLRFEINEPTEDLKVEISWDGDKPFIEKHGKRVR